MTTTSKYPNLTPKDAMRALTWDELTGLREQIAKIAYGGLLSEDRMTVVMEEITDNNYFTYMRCCADECDRLAYAYGYALAMLSTGNQQAEFFYLPLSVVEVSPEIWKSVFYIARPYPAYASNGNPLVNAQEGRQ